MRKPLDKSLAQWIRELYRDGKIYSFYKSREWLSLREEVLRDAHNECEECIKRGIYERAVLVHHVNEVRDRPDLALSKTYKDAEGKEHRNLKALCFACHEEEHGRAWKGQERKKSAIELEVPEMW